MSTLEHLSHWQAHDLSDETMKAFYMSRQTTGCSDKATMWKVCLKKPSEDWSVQFTTDKELVDGIREYIDRQPNIEDNEGHNKPWDTIGSVRVGRIHGYSFSDQVLINIITHHVTAYESLSPEEKTMGTYSHMRWIDCVQRIHLTTGNAHSTTINTLSTEGCK